MPQLIRLTLLPAIMLLSLVGCQPYIAPQSPVTTPVEMVKPTIPPVPRAFQLTGKIGVRTPQQSGSAFYAWGQQDQRFSIDLSGALGIGQTTIESNGTRFVLQNANTGRLEADQPETLLEQATGWRAPISLLPKWIMGLPDQASSPATYDAKQRLQTLTEQGWSVRFDYADEQAVRPSKLVMTQTVDGGENRVTLTIQTRQETP